MLRQSIDMGIKILVCLLLSIVLSDKIYAQDNYIAFLNDNAEKILLKLRSESDTFIAYGEFCNHCINGTIEILHIAYKKNGSCYYRKIVYPQEKSGLTINDEIINNECIFFDMYSHFSYSINDELDKAESILIDTIKVSATIFKTVQPLSDGKMQFFYINIGSSLTKHARFCCGSLTNNVFWNKMPGLWMIISAFHNL